MGYVPSMAAGRRRKRRLSKLVTARLVNPVVRPLLDHARLPGWALLETTGRRSGRPRRVPLGDGLRGNAFVTEQLTIRGDLDRV